jgi:chromosome segregation ATPase
MKKLMLLSVALSFASSAGAAFRCVDEKGVTHIGDTPPEQCANVVMHEVSRSGMVMRSIDPTPTPEQAKAKLIEQEKKREADKQAAEQKRKDMALLNSFAAEREFDVARDRNIEPLNGRIRSAQDRLKAVEKRAKQLEDEMEFYNAGKSGKSGKAREPPANLVQDMARVKAEKITLEKSVVDSEKEIEQVKIKFEADKKRWIAIKSGATPKPAEYVTPASEMKTAPPAKGRY